ncbi:heavy metal translocating P-type ATPase [Corynebacterium mayonis]|uniref:heavy metal translocating P-type ATPase n=1 Tax=Corynebacterium mayonis TaxID=3062461 RepID=UPI00313FED9A
MPNNDLDDYIDAARTAALDAGFDPDTPHEDTRSSFRPHTAYAFELSGLTDAPQLKDIEDALGRINGVRARLVYQTATAWVTTSEDVNLEKIIEVIESFGVKARMTDSTLRRRAIGRRAAEHPMPRRGTRGMTGKMRRQRRDEEANLVRERASGFLRGEPRRNNSAHIDVLFTARDMVTPLRMWVAILITAPVLAMSYLPQLQFDGWQWVTLALATPVALWCAFPFHRAMAGGVRRGMSALDGASSIAIIASYLWSLIALVFTSTGHIGWHSPGGWLSAHRTDGMELFFDVVCGVTAMLLVGRHNSTRVRSYFLQDMETLRTGPDHEYTVIRRRPGEKPATEKLRAPEINRGYDVKLGPGEIIPVDGDVVGGSCELERPLIDAREPLEAKVGTRVYAGTVIKSGSIKVRVVRTGHATRWAAVQSWVEDASRRENMATMLSTRTAGMLIPAAYFIAVSDFGLWFLITGNYNIAFATAMSILAVVAPVALAISPAVAIRLGIEAAARNGILLRDGETFRGLENADTVVFNRVGTLVTPQMMVETVTAEHGEDPDLVLRIAAALSMESQHPMSKALVKAARESRDKRAKDSSMPAWIELSNNEITSDGDVKGRLTLTYENGSEGEEHTESFDAKLWRPTNLSRLHGRLAIAATSGGAPVVVRWKGKDRGVITLYDPAKPDAIEAVERLEDMGLETVMLTRDTYPVARRFADFLGVSNVLAGIPSPSKPIALRALRSQGATVVMVGDHTIVDTLRSADVGILYVTEESVNARLGKMEQCAEVVLLRNDVTAVPQLIELARRVSGIIDTNMFFAWAYNCVAIILAVVGVLPPVGATLLMLGSSMFIELRSARARRFPT